MRRFTRLPEPDFLAQNWESWGADWDSRKQADPRAVFYWHQYDNERVNRKLLPTLKSQTQKHCSFCDNFPISPPSPDTIEHFRPKSTFPRLAYQWRNLYYCCGYCQQKKGESFNESALEPDAENFQFSDYFYWDYTTGILQVREDITADAKKRAHATISLYGLNEEHPALRRLAFLKRARAKDLPIEDFPYRNFVD